MPKKIELKKVLLDRMLRSRDPRRFSLKELAWAYVHGFPKGTDEEDVLKTMLLAKAKEMTG